MIPACHTTSRRWPGFDSQRERSILFFFGIFPLVVFFLFFRSTFWFSVFSMLVSFFRLGSLGTNQHGIIIKWVLVQDAQRLRLPHFSHKPFPRSPGLAYYIDSLYPLWTRQFHVQAIHDSQANKCFHLQVISSSPAPIRYPAYYILVHPSPVSTNKHEWQSRGMQLSQHQDGFKRMSKKQKVCGLYYYLYSITLVTYNLSFPPLKTPI